MFPGPLAPAFRLAGLALLPILTACPAPRNSAGPFGGAASGSSDDLGDAAGDDAMTTGASDPGSDAGSGTVGNATDDAADAGPDGSTGGSDGGSSDGSGSDGGEPTTGAPSCDSVGGACMPAIPQDWQGPAVMLPWADADSPVDCEGAFDIAVTTSGSYDLVAPDPACGCDCGAPDGGSCSGEVTLTEAALFNGDCFPLGAAPIETMSANSAVSIDETGPIGVGYSITEAPTYSGGSCEPNGPSTIDPAYFENNVTLCTGSVPSEGTCDGDELCAPEPTAGATSLCIWQEAATFCPDTFPDQLIVYGDIEDTRDCTECLCGEPGGACSDGTVTMYGSYNQTPLTQTGTPNDCAVWASGTHASSALWLGVVPTDDAGCAPIGGEAVGDAHGVAPLTICCTEV